MSFNKGSFHHYLFKWSLSSLSGIPHNSYIDYLMMAHKSLGSLHCFFSLFSFCSLDVIILIVLFANCFFCLLKSSVEPLSKYSLQQLYFSESDFLLGPFSEFLSLVDLLCSYFIFLISFTQFFVFLFCYLNILSQFF